uniref:MADF domain-containing protein n=1 Tax=Oryzias melastigma TaxID=30732 RepID=A0A3B3B8F7_ORYME
MTCAASMDDKLILAVFHYPELYNATLPNYRCTESRANAWRNIGKALGLPPEDCKRKWKNLRDRYLKEVRMETKNKRQGVFVQSKWRYRQSMNFIAPFTGSRGTGADTCGEQDQENFDEFESPDGEAAMLEPAKTLQNNLKLAVIPPESKSQAVFVTQPCLDHQGTQLAAKMPPGSQVTPQSNAGRKRKLMPETGSPPSPSGTHSPTKWLVKEDGVPFGSRPRDEDELFLLSFVPALKRLAPQKRCETKMKIQQIMYEAEFNVALTELQEKKVEA